MNSGKVLKVDKEKPKNFDDFVAVSEQVVELVVVVDFVLLVVVLLA